jgi:16S rRNA (cytidine1402-2'-O)-methyltransferase
MPPGTLYLVATPIGNLEDITLRALRVLKEADLIACEDTRHTGRLLAHYSIEKALVSYHEHNEASRAAELIERLRSGTTIAMVSDAGMPLVSDPGYRLVRAAVDAGIPVQPIPGPAALIAAVAASGLPTDSFRFGGFLPAKAGQRARVLEAAADESATLIFYEAPHRLLDTLADIDRLLGPRPVVVARELTKLHEEFLRGTAGSIRDILASRESVKGEITLLIGKAQPETADESSLEEAAAKHMARGASRMDAIKAVARERGLPKREVYRRLQESGPGGE